MSGLRRGVVLIVIVVIAACGGTTTKTAQDVPPSTPPPGTDTTETTAAPERRGLPPVTVRGGDAELVLQPWTFCYGGLCADGAPPDPLEQISDADQVVVEFPLSGWSFTATFQPSGTTCPRRHTVPLTENGDGTFTLEPAGHAGRYDVTLAGRGDGDLFVSFQWVTQTDGPLAVPEARLAVIADHDGQPDSYGVDLELANLATTPATADARITVRSTEGRALTFDATRVETCTAEGSVYWHGPADQGKAAAGLGTAPFTYDVTVTLDGTAHTATARWPDDLIDGNEPSVALRFSPALPALA